AQFHAFLRLRVAAGSGGSGLVLVAGTYGAGSQHTPVSALERIEVESADGTTEIHLLDRATKWPRRRST
ncbi:hypothetical protein, partial [Acinetobacter baumannii]|uniref:hypothetical protein n=1 Tax=Acinetobacter baumannii TaxID=470 RepID=UPI001D17BAAE